MDRWSIGGYKETGSNGLVDSCQGSLEKGRSVRGVSHGATGLLMTVASPVSLKLWKMGLLLIILNGSVCTSQKNRPNSHDKGQISSLLLILSSADTWRHLLWCWVLWFWGNMSPLSSSDMKTAVVPSSEIMLASTKLYGVIICKITVSRIVTTVITSNLSFPAIQIIFQKAMSQL